MPNATLHRDQDIVNRQVLVQELQYLATVQVKYLTDIAHILTVRLFPLFFYPGPSDIQCCVKGGSGSSCTCNSYNMCTNVPADGNYYLTSFCDSAVACGSFSGNCNEYYAADYARFGCNSVISCCQGNDCLNLKVIDGGPSCEVENNAG